MSDSWIRLDANYYGSDGDTAVMAVAVDHGMAALAYWPALLAAAKRAKGFGQVELTVAGFGASVCDWPAGPEWIASRVALWRAFEAAGLITIEGDLIPPMTVFTVTIRSWAKWQSMTAAERAKAYRDRAASSRETVTGRNPRAPKTAPNGANGNPSRSSRDSVRIAPIVTEIRSGEHTPDTGDIDPSLRSGSSAETSSGRDPAKLKRKATVKAQSDDDVVNAIDRCREQLNGCSEHVDRLVQILAAENKTGKVRLSRTLTALWQPLADAMKDEGLPADAMRHGLQAAIDNAAPNHRYVLKAARGHLQRRATGAGNGAGARPSVHLTTPTPEGNNDGRYDDIDWLTT